MGFKRLSAAAMAALALLAVPHPSAAQNAPRPVAAVIKFESNGTQKVDDKVGEAMADELAGQLVESGRFRALDRAWLPTAKINRAPMETLLSAAVDSGVDYLIVGSVGKISKPVQTWKTSTSRVVRMPVPLVGSRNPYGPMLRPVITHRAFMTLRVRLINAHTGDVVQTAMAELPMPNTPTAALVVTSLLLRSPVAAAAAAVSKLAKPSGLDGNIQRALTNIARDLITQESVRENGKGA